MVGTYLFLRALLVQNLPKREHERELGLGREISDEEEEEQQEEGT